MPAEESSEDKPRIEDIDTAPTTLPESREAVPVERFNEVFESLSRISQDNAELLLRNEILERKDQTRQILDILLEPYAKRTFIFMCVYCAFVALVLLMQAFGCFGVGLSDGVLQILAGSTAVTVIGLVGMVLTGIFVGARK